jgi:predicted naringenin-chalcone synthase
MHWDPEGVKGNALFADGAAALVLGQRSPHASAHRLLRGTGSFVIPQSRGEMSWIVGDHGFEMSLTSQVPVLIEEHLRGWMSAWLDRFGRSIEDIGNWVVHPGSRKIIEAAERSLGLAAETCSESREVLRRYGNMSSPTVLFILERLQQDQDKPIVLLGFGPGLTAEAALLEPGVTA